MAENQRHFKQKEPNAVGCTLLATTIYEGAQSKLWSWSSFKTIDPNARHCMASAAAAFLRTFGMDEPMGCYNVSKKPMRLYLGVQTCRKPNFYGLVFDRRLSSDNVRKLWLPTFEHPFV